MSFGDRDPIPKEVRKDVKNKFGGHCAYCGLELGRSFHVDHVIPVAEGGIDDIVNYFPACVQCNTFKNSFSFNQFRYILETQSVEKTSFVLAERFEQITVHPKKIVFYFEKQGHVFDEDLVRTLMKTNPRIPK